MFTSGAFSQESNLYPLGGTVSDLVLHGKGGAPLRFTKYLGVNRILLVFVPNEASSQALGYLATLNKNDRKLAERDMQALMVVNEDSPLLESECGPHTVVAIRSERIMSATPLDESAPLCVLIGKDTTIKLREPTFVDLGAIFTKVDSMPMRRSELKNRTGSAP